MFVNGQAMSGGSLNTALQDATFLGPARTAAHYRFYSVRDEFPGLLPVDEQTNPISGELYAVDYQTLRHKLLPNEPTELELCVIELDTGEGSLCMRMRDSALNLPDVTDITSWGGWRAYLETKDSHRD